MLITKGILLKDILDEQSSRNFHDEWSNKTAEGSGDLTVENERVEEYLKHCKPTSEQGLYLRLLSGFKTVKSKLCDDAVFKELLNRNQRCYDNVKYEVMSCIGPEDWIEIENATKVCKIMKSVMGCHYTKTLVNCDILAAEVLNELMKNIMSSVKEVQCKNIVQGTFVRDLRSIVKGSTTKLVPEILSVLILALTLL
ncbi:uncharacterized protein [Halyomorpha halys]|uniref:uncharacterized protein isoform X2 n=1 Tax=Halyomorpha halys TaxID=286706 RepID=UPI0006D4D071|nr:uncharacterized protein LOC106684103 isoform X2 [Halyomorpha halys]XP_014281480.1 uncharacterized protein LOC106684103 isoform X2 [Halyomorpha halys]